MTSPETPAPYDPEAQESGNLPRVTMVRQLLQVNDRKLEPSDGPEMLQAALTYGQQAILQGLEEFRDYMQGLHPDSKIAIAPIEAMLLPGKPKDVLSATGLERHRSHEQIFPDISHLQDQFHPFWHAVEASGYVPEVRVHGHQNGRYPIYLWAHLPDAESAEKDKQELSIEQLPEKLGFVETDYMKEVRRHWSEALASGSSETAKLNEAYSQLVYDEGLRIASVENEEAYIKATVGINIAVSLVWRDAWEMSRDPAKAAQYIEELNDVLLQMVNEGHSPRNTDGWGFSKVYDCIEAEIARVEQSLHSK